MVTLNIAMKLNETHPLKLETLVELSSGCFTEENMITYEIFILRTLAWNVHPPTALSFARKFVQFLPSSVSSSTKKDVVEISRFLLELAVCDYSLVVCPPSFLAIAAILNAIDDLGPTRFPHLQFDCAVFLENIAHFVGGENNSGVTLVQERIAHIYQERTDFTSEEISALRNVDSPVCVSTVENGCDSSYIAFKETGGSAFTNNHVTSNSNVAEQSRKLRKLD
eukprot:CAMPEP_0194348376 /NCGR_PEP_ID=MMETSP0171-20130528/106503_1 /TAXON_ID=218684 /ORGANISM="Corethron pennatum, Strain L29A3" /LENGTH=223 /DNA_ID=CAMNT_0039115713 /DNA_START=548 /DNA_END=1219 /DNA_ORIENTATION=-